MCYPLGMPTLLLPSLGMLGMGLALYDYKRKRFSSPEDRYMQLYAKDEWTDNDMDMRLHFSPAADQVVKSEFLRRLSTHLQDLGSGLHEVAEIQDDEVHFHYEQATVEALLQPRQGIHFDLSITGQIHVIWNHMQLDGVALWRILRTLFDDNPPLLPFKPTKTPPPIFPELLSTPQIAKQLLTRGVLHKGMEDGVHTGFQMWDTEEIRLLKEELNLPFNLLSSALVAQQCFERHPKAQKLNLGLTVYFPFLKARNRYGVILLKVKRGDLANICRQMTKKIPSPLKVWGSTAVQSYAMTRVPDGLFLRMMKYYRKQIDVLISNVPVGTLPISIDEQNVQISCHARGLSVPYYFLLMGTRQHIHLSYTTRYSQDNDFVQSPIRFLASTTK